MNGGDAEARALSNLFCFEPLGGRLEQPVCGENIVGQSEPPQHRRDLPRSADGELVEAPLPKTRVDAFVQSAPLVDLLALGAVHALAPSGNARAIVGTRRIGIGLVLAHSVSSFLLKPPSTRWRSDRRP